MQISLKQSEIEVALKNYVSQQGISLYARDVSIAFTAGRKESGISADITIEDTEIPFGEDILTDSAGIPTILLKSEPKVLNLVAATAVLTDPAPEVSEPVEVVEKVVEPIVEASTEPTKSTSLFG